MVPSFCADFEQTSFHMKLSVLRLLNVDGVPKLQLRACLSATLLLQHVIFWCSIITSCDSVDLAWSLLTVALGWPWAGLNWLCFIIRGAFHASIMQPLHLRLAFWSCSLRAIGLALFVKQVLALGCCCRGQCCPSSLGPPARCQRPSRFGFQLKPELSRAASFHRCLQLGTLQSTGHCGYLWFGPLD